MGIFNPGIVGTVGTTSDAIPVANSTGGRTLKASSATVNGNGTMSVPVSGVGVPCLTLTQGSTDIDSPFINFVGDINVVRASEMFVGPTGGNGMLMGGYVKCQVNSSDTFDETGTVREIYLPLCYEDCFEEGTLVLTPSGPRPIEDIKEGDEVYSFNHDINEVRVNIVKRAMHHPKARGRIKINNHPKGVSQYHHLWINDEYLSVTELKIGDYFRNYRQEKVWVFNLDWDPSAAPTYNLQMENQRMANYFAGLAGDEGEYWLAHNKCPFLFYYDETAVYPWRCQGTFVTGRDCEEKVGTDRIRLKDLTSKLYIWEIEPEVSKIWDICQIAVADGYETKLKRIDRRENCLELKKGDRVPVEFEPYPQGTTELYFQATGFYKEQPE